MLNPQMGGWHWNYYIHLQKIWPCARTGYSSWAPANHTSQNGGVSPSYHHTPPTLLHQTPYPSHHPPPITSPSPSPSTHNSQSEQASPTSPKFSLASCLPGWLAYLFSNKHQNTLIFKQMHTFKASQSYQKLQLQFTQHIHNKQNNKNNSRQIKNTKSHQTQKISHGSSVYFLHWSRGHGHTHQTIFIHLFNHW